MAQAYIFDAVRSPRGRGKADGSLYTVRPVELLAQVLRALRDRNALDTSHVEDASSTSSSRAASSPCPA